jgi:REP element-mobilizing transposase RayT
MESAQHDHAAGKWFVHIFLLMPDHLHAIVSIPTDGSLPRQIAGFKRFTSRRTGIEWQKGFFDHRLRNDESLEEKAHYIAMNPVRKSLVNKPADWKWVYRSVNF